VTTSEYASLFCSIDVVNLSCFQSRNTQDIGSSSSTLAYVIYTSGTTGKPKGVLQTHANVNRLIQASGKVYDFCQDDCWIVLHEYVFDFSVWEIWSSLLRGCKLVIPSVTEAKDVQRMVGLIDHNAITVLNQTPSLFYVFADYVLDFGVSFMISSLRYIVFAGESLNTSKLGRWFEEIGTRVALVNMYGITETTVHLTAKAVKSTDGVNNVGKVLCDQYVLVLDRFHNLVPIGHPGEIYVGGAGLAQGYLNRDQLTLERFIDNPFGEGKLYKSGDLGRWLVTGELEYLGRNDSQIKIRGFRVELGEIEGGLLKLSGVSQACAVVRGERLDAYLVGDIPAEKIRVALEKHLPGYMIPSTFTFLDEFPRTINGKLDTKALPQPTSERVKEFVPPTTVTQVKLCKLIESLLGCTKVGISDNLFELGATSIDVIRFSGLVHSQLGFQLPIRDIFERKTVAAFCSAMIADNHCIIPVREESGVVSFSEERLLFLSTYDEQASSAYHMPLVLSLSTDVNVEFINKSIEWLVHRHEILRTVYNSQYLQRAVLDADGLKPSSIEALDVFINTKFCLDRDFPFRYGYLDVNGVKHLVFVFHHIAFDGWSNAVFIRELDTAYKALSSTGIPPTLPSLEIQYRDFACWERSKIADDSVQFWLHELEGFETLHLQTDYPRPAEVDYGGTTFYTKLSKGLSERIIQFAKSQESTLFATLLAAFYVFLHKMSGQSDIVVGTAAANRGHPQTQDLIGFFCEHPCFACTTSHYLEYLRASSLCV